MLIQPELTTSDVAIIYQLMAVCFTVHCITCVAS